MNHELTKIAMYEYYLVLMNKETTISANKNESRR